MLNKQTWLDGNDSERAPGLNVEWYCCKCAGDIDAGAYNITCSHTPNLLFAFHVLFSDTGDKIQQ